MARKPHKPPHVKTVKRNGREYLYFNTGQRRANGNPIYTPLPPMSAADFWPTYTALDNGRKRRETPAYSVADLMGDYLTSAAFAKLAKSTQSNYRLHGGYVKEVWGKFRADGLQSQYVREIVDKGIWGPGSTNMVIAVLGSAYRWGRRSKNLTVNPVRDVDRSALGQHEPWPDDVLEAALVCDDSEVRLAVHLLYFTGQRIGDVMKMRWGDIRDGHIYVQQQKTRKVVEPPLISDLVAELDRTPREGLTIIHGIGVAKLRRKLKAFTKAHGVDAVPHGLRKNAVIAFLYAGCTVPEVAAITGQTHQVVEHYAARVNRRNLGKAAVVKFEAWNKRSTGKHSGKSG
jgi:integrase